MSNGDFRLLVGLGNPGKKYENTRHNIGFMILQRLASQNCETFRVNKKLLGYLSEFSFGEKPIRLLMPNTYMNESGRSIRATLEWFNLKPDNIIVLVDDMDLPLGKLRLRKHGSSGGHNGLKSTINHLETEIFSRLRIGIGSPSLNKEERKEKTISHVLGRFSSNETQLVDQIIQEVIAGLEVIQRNGLEQGRNRINSFCPAEINL